MAKRDSENPEEQSIERDAELLEGEGIKRYDRLRQYLSLIYLYGCFDAKSLAEMNNNSVKDYYPVMELIREMFWPESWQKAETDSDSHVPQVLRKYDASAKNRMADSYMMFSMNKKPLLVLYLRLLQRLEQGEANVPELTESLRGLPAVEEVSEQTTRNHALELVKYGYATLDVHTKKYRLVSDGLCKLKVEELEELYTYVCFAAGVTYPRVPGSFLRRTLEREIRSRKRKIPEDSVFLLRNNSNHNVFDEEVVFRMLHMIRRRRALQIDGAEYLPVKLRVDCRLGRWYALMAGEHKGELQPTVRAVPRMELLTPSGRSNSPLWEQAAAVVDAAYGEKEGLFSGLQTEKPTLVEVKLHFDGEIGRQEQFRRELRIGGIEPSEDGPYYRAKIRDPLELLPLLRSYAPWLEALPGDHDLRARLADSLRQMQRNLDGEPWPPYQENRHTFEKRTSGEVDKEKQKLEEKEEKEKAKERRLVNIFQSRLLQFSLDLLADPRQNGTDKTFVAALAKRYGFHQTGRIIDLLKEAGFIDGKDPRPRLPMSLVEREYLQYILDPQNMPEEALFLSKQTKDAIFKNVFGCTGEEDKDLPKKKCCWTEHIQWMKAPGMELPVNPGPEGFRELIRAIRGRRMITYRYRVRGEQDEKEGKCLPWKLEYSAYDRRWWVILYDPAPKEKRTIKTPLNHLRGIKVLENNENANNRIPDSEISEAMENLRMKEPVVLRIRDEHNALLRCFTAFENQEISGSGYSPEEGYTLTFRGFRFDEQEILRQLMYLGPNVRLEGPKELREELGKRLVRAQRYNCDPETNLSAEI